MIFEQLKDQDFKEFQKLLFELSGISLSNEKKALVSGRLQKRLRHYQLESYSEYLKIIRSGDEAEIQTMLNLLTTNETYFYREPDHFDILKNQIWPNWKGNAVFRVWSAASSTGEEAFTIAFTLAEAVPERPWEIFGSDINEDVVERAAQAVYPMSRSENIPKQILKKYCLKGVRSQEGMFLIKNELRRKVHFQKENLLQITPAIGKFDVIFLRNVMIYFNNETRKKVIENLIPHLHDDGFLIVGHSESLFGVTNELKTVRPTVYQKIDANTHLGMRLPRTK